VAAPVAFVGGATGFVGRATVAALCRRGVRTLAHVRPDSTKLATWRERFAADGAEVDTTAWDAAALAARFRAVAPTHVFVLIGTTRARAKADGVAGDIYETIDVGLTRLLAGAAAAVATAGGTAPRLIYLSSVGASETAGSAYLRARGRAEAAVRSAGVPWAIARPSIISGPGREDDRPAERLAAGVTDGALAVVGALGGRRVRDKYRSTTPDILAAALVRIGLDDPRDRIFEGAELR